MFENKGWLYVIMSECVYCKGAVPNIYNNV